MRNTFSEIAAGLLMFLFVYTGSSKVINHNAFETVLHTSPLLQRQAFILSAGIPLIEIILVVLLFLPNKRTAGFLGSGVLLVMFTLYISYMVVFVKDLPCSCGGVLKELTWRQHLLFNIFFIGVAVAGWFVERKKKKYIIAIKPLKLKGNRAGRE